MMMKPGELKKKTRGIIHLVMTHFDKNGLIDEQALRTSVDYAAKALKGQDAMFMTLGSTAEFYAMSDEECKQIIRIVVEQVNGRFPVITGVGRSGTKPTIEMARYAQQTGADGLMVMSPYYLPATEDGLYRHFSQVAESVDIALLIYNNPSTTKLWIPPPLMAKLSKIDNIIADKETVSDILAFYWMQKTIDPKDMVVLCGVGQMMVQFCAVVNCPGFVTEYVNFAPEIAIGLYDAMKKKDFDMLARISDRIAPYHSFVSKIAKKRGALPSVVSPYILSPTLPFIQSVVKEAMALKGLPGGKAREPMENLTQDEIKELKQVLQEVGVL